MLKWFGQELCGFDIEWVPDPAAGRRLYGFPADMQDAGVVDLMYRRAKGYDAIENPRPFLPLALCRVVSVAAAWWRIGTPARVTSWACEAEVDTIAPLPLVVGERRPQLWSFNGRGADLPMLLQRAATHRVPLTKFCARPGKPWEGVDYFDRYSGHHVDLMDTPLGERQSLADLCAGLGIPGKGSVSGADVADLWAAGARETVALYNETDAMRVIEIAARVAAMLGVGGAPLEWDAATLERHPEFASQAARVSTTKEEAKDA